MKKKIIASLLAFGMLGAVTAMADTEPAVAGYTRNAVVDKIGASANDGIVTISAENSVIITGYNEEGILKFAKLYTPVDGNVITEDNLTQYDTVKVNDIIEKTVKTVMWASGTPVMPTATPVPTASPAPTTEPDATPEPTVNPSATYNPNVFPAVYEKAINAVYAPAVIESVAQEVNDSQQGHRIEYYWQGTKHSDWFSEDIKLVSHSDDPSLLVKSSLSGLKRGDVVYMNRYMNGNVKDISLLYIAQKTDIINNSTDFGTHFEKLFGVNYTNIGTNTGTGDGAETVDAKDYSAWTVLKYGQTAPNKGNQYAFGVIGRRENTVLYLLNKTGNINSSIILQMADDAVVYECDMRNTSGIKVSRPLSITSKIPSITWNNAYGTENPTIDLTDDGYNYALARVVDGIVMDIVVYSNY